MSSLAAENLGGAAVELAAQSGPRSGAGGQGGALSLPASAGAPNPAGSGGDLGEVPQDELQGGSGAGAEVRGAGEAGDAGAADEHEDLAGGAAGAAAGSGADETADPVADSKDAGAAAGDGPRDDDGATRDAGPAPGPGSADDTDEAYGVPGIVAVGYGGLRIVSRDLGLTWEDEIHWSENGGDDRDLLRTIAYGNGTWVSGGWRITTSEDGVHWTDRGDAEDVISVLRCQVTDGMAFGNGHFVVACGSSLAISTDGLEWESAGRTPNVGGHPYLIFDAASEQFACSGDDGASYVSVDGRDWTELAIDTVHLCADGLTPESDCRGFYHEGVLLSAEWGGYIRRSETGSNWRTQYTDPFDNNLFTSYSFGVGRVAP